MTGKKIAIVYDWLDKWGGVERVLLTFHEMFPEADWFTSYVDEKKATWIYDLRFKNSKIHPSFIQKLPSFIKNNRILSLPFYSYAFESFDFSHYDLLISITSSFAKGIITKPGTQHICYLLTPTRLLWSQHDIYTKNWIPAFAGMTSPYMSKLREWDYVAAQRPDRIISISKNVAQRCEKYYRRESEILYPPFYIDYWSGLKNSLNCHPELARLAETSPKLISGSKEIPDQVRNDIHENYYLAVSRLEPYKMVDLVIEFFNERKEQLIIVGTGSQKPKLQNLAGKNIRFFENITDLELAQLYSNAKALIMLQEEDFGYVALEAQFFGCPVIAYLGGGALETVSEKMSGIFFDKQTTSALRDGFERFMKVSYNRKVNVKFFEKFSKIKFIDSFKNNVS